MEKNEAYFAKVININNFVNYSKDAIVSKVLLEKENGTITFFAFDQKQNLSEHTAPFDALVQIIEGEAEILIDKKTNIVKQGEFIIMPKNIPHAANAKIPFKMILTLIK